jgi:hypothetical protein
MARDLLQGGFPLLGYSDGFSWPSIGINMPSVELKGIFAVRELSAFIMWLRVS